MLEKKTNQGDMLMLNTIHHMNLKSYDSNHHS